jgi:hypothetical protein
MPYSTPSDLTASVNLLVLCWGAFIRAKGRAYCVMGPREAEIMDAVDALWEED